MILSIYIVDLIHAQLSDCDEYLVNQIVSYSPLDFPEEWLKLPLHCHFRNQQGNYLFGPRLAAYQDHTCCFIFKGFTFLVLPVELVRLLVIQGLMRNFWDAHPSAQTTATMHAALVHLQGFQFSQHKLHRSIMPHHVKSIIILQQLQPKYARPPRWKVCRLQSRAVKFFVSGVWTGLVSYCEDLCRSIYSEP